MPKLTEDVAKWAPTQRHSYGNGNFGNFETDFWGPGIGKEPMREEDEAHEQHELQTLIFESYTHFCSSRRQSRQEIGSTRSLGQLV